jgi:hypothetical protein
LQKIVIDDDRDENKQKENCTGDSGLVDMDTDDNNVVNGDLIVQLARSTNKSCSDKNSGTNTDSNESSKSNDSDQNEKSENTADSDNIYSNGGEKDDDNTEKKPSEFNE